MGVVFLARHLRLQRLVALKMILSGPYAGPSELARFALEASAAAQLQDPGIVQVYEVGEVEGRPFLALEYVEGGALADRLDGTPWPALAAARFVEELARAIHHAHQHGIVHRDLKPENVLLAPGEGAGARAPGSATHWSWALRPKIGDFGLAKNLGAGSGQTQTGAILGTPSYMAPEQAAGRVKEIGPPSDVYALGTILYELLTGRPPFLAPTPIDTVLQVLRQEPVPPRRLVPQMPVDLQTICLKALEKAPAGRLASAALLAEELHRFREGRPILSRPAGALERGWRWCRRNPAQALLTGAVLSLLLALIVGTMVVAVWLRQGRDEALRNLDRAQLAEKDAVDALYESLLSQARALRWSGQPGRHFESVEALTRAARIRPARAVRNELLACLPLVDVREDPTSRGELVDDASVVAFDADLARYACSDARGAISVRRAADGQEFLSLPGPGEPCFVLVFSARGRYLAAKYHRPNANASNRVIVWDLKEGKPLLELRSLVNGAMDFSSDDRLFAFGKERSLTIHELPAGTQRNTFALASEPCTVRFHPHDSDRLALSSVEGHHVQVVQARTGAVQKSLPASTGLHGVAWSASGHLLAGSGTDGRLFLWDVQRAFAFSTLEGHQATATEVVFHPSGDLLASCGWDNSLKLWHPQSRRCLLTLSGFKPLGSPVLRFSPDGRALASALAGQRIRTCEIHPALECRTIPAQTSRLWDAHISRDGRWLTLSLLEGFVLWDVAEAREIARVPIGPTRAAFFHPNGRELISWGVAGLSRWPLEFAPDGRCTGTGPREALGVKASALPEWTDLSPDGRYCAVGDRGNGEVLVTDLVAGKVIFRRPYRNPSRVALSPDGRWLAAGPWADGEPRVRVWDLHSGEEAATFAEPNGTHLAFTPDGRWLITGTPNFYRFRDPGAVESDRQVETEGRVPGTVALHPSRPLAAISIKPGHLRLLNTETLEEYASFPGGDPIRFSADGTHLLTRSDATTVQVWDLTALRRRLRTLGLDWDLPE
jgi:WD40 repeat protein